MMRLILMKENIIIPLLKRVEMEAYHFKDIPFTAAIYILPLSSLSYYYYYPPLHFFPYYAHYKKNNNDNIQEQILFHIIIHSLIDFHNNSFLFLPLQRTNIYTHHRTPPH
ncbi:hypothetical protein BDC45DRAFT_276574 [Circinella umbellata]|nr:hypothetical protein BDC45DRAFT_276574 [Circinella umbellata]